MQFLLVLQLYHIPHPLFLHYVLEFFDCTKSSHTTGAMLDALVMIFGNTEFMNWVFNQILELQIFWRNHKNSEDLREKNTSGEGKEFVIMTTTGTSSVQ
jgi:hypothetical protein